ncbi:MAG: trigger factor [Candidatus Dormiibacterota bacterium]
MTTASPELSVFVERKPGWIVELSVEAPAGELDRAVGDASRRLGARLRIPGFRPGRAPAALVERAVGWEALRREAAESLIPQLYARALEQAGVDPVGDPELTLGTMERGLSVTFTAQVPVRPEVDLGDYLSMRVEPPRTEVTEADVDAALEEVRRRFSDLEEVSRPSQAGDVLRSVLVMRRGEEVLSGGDERDLELDRERLVPGLVDALLGLEAGAERSFPLTLPNDYQREELRGVTVQADARVVAVRERKLPPLDDDLARRDQSGDTVDEMRRRYRELLAESATRADEDRHRSDVLAALRQRVKVDVPSQMVERELDAEMAAMEQRLGDLGLRFDRYLEYTGSTAQKFREERREAAANQVRLELALGALAAAEQLEVDESQVDREVERVAAGRRLTAEQRRRLHTLTHQDLLRRAAIDRAVEIARGQA